MAERLYTIEADGVKLVLDRAVGHVRAFEVSIDGRRIEPLHTAPWLEEPDIVQDDGIDNNLKFLSGDFFCAPFAASDVEPAPPHGWPANAEWTPLGDERLADGVTARFGLERRVMGARVIKEITLRNGHPFAYQRHVFEGGSGAVSAASHAMTRFAEPGRLSFSSKAYADLPSMVQEGDPDRGRSLFATSRQVEDLSKLPLADGTTVDLHRYPVADRHEDFVMLVESPDSPLGWTAAVRPAVGDVLLSLKNPADYPVTFLWFSNGGRLYPPWNGRHLGVLGVEEGRAYSAYGHQASIEPNPLSESGIPTSLSLDPDGTVSVAHAIGGLPLPEGASEVFDVEAMPNGLRVTVNDGGTREYAFDPAFLALASL
ncbi:MAG: hypothetical protein GY798_05490 [Hyphomicrobiales bacterium]|nr:hypothetical protein [Hyphomicrobiales bacterium]